MKSTLVVIFNVDYSKVIPRVEALYAGRFSQVLYLVPDFASRFRGLYEESIIPVEIVKAVDGLWNLSRRAIGRRNQHELRGDAPPELRRRIIKVLGYQIYFYDFICQAAARLDEEAHEWLWFLGDDVLLRPGIDEASLARAYVSGEDTEAVICRPFTPSKQWIEGFHGALGDFNTRLARAVGPWSREEHLRSGVGPTDGIEGVKTCADFFGLRKSALSKILPFWKACFRERIFVEAAVPAVMTRRLQHVTMIEDYLWHFGNRRRGWKEMLEELERSPGALFTHPVKLSEVALSDVAELRRTRRSAMEAPCGPQPPNAVPGAR